MAATTRDRNVNVSSALDELFPTREGPQVDKDAVWIERGLIEANPRQPRKKFSPGTLRELGDSLKANGQLQACVVRPHPDKPGHFQIISGERRWRASGPEFADLPRLRCVIREADDAEAFRLALAENVHREDLSVVERARALVQIKESEPGFTWEKVAEQAQLSKRRILHLVELLKLPDDVVAHIETGDINEKHARALLALQKQPDKQRLLLEEVLRDDLSGNAALARVEKRGEPRSPAGAQPSVVAVGKTTPPKPGKRLPDDSDTSARHLAGTSGGSGGKAGTGQNHTTPGRVEAIALFEPILHAVDRAVEQAEGEDDGEPGFTIARDSQQPAFKAEAREQLRQIKGKIEALEKAVLPDG